MAEDQPPRDSNPQWTFGSIALLVIGLLILIPSGLCTALFGFMGLMNGASAQAIMMTLEVGGIPMAVGAILVFLGWAASRRN